MCSFVHHFECMVCVRAYCLKRICLHNEPHFAITPQIGDCCHMQSLSMCLVALHGNYTMYGSFTINPITPGWVVFLAYLE